MYVPALDRNGVARLPGTVHRSQRDSRIHWQPWSTESFTHAEQANRLVLAIFCNPPGSDHRRVIDALEKDPRILQAMGEYVPVLVDLSAVRECRVLTRQLCKESEAPVETPLLVWMTPARNPIAWTPIGGPDVRQIGAYFLNYHEMIRTVWAEDPQYVLTNSANDVRLRAERMHAARQELVSSTQVEADTLAAIRQVNSYYDAINRTFDRTNEKFPVEIMDLLSAAAMNPGAPAEVRTQCHKTLELLLEDLLRSAMFDPLDGGAFTGRSGASWSLPSFARDCATQGKVAVTLFKANRATGNPLALERALGVLKFAETNFSTPGGLFALGDNPVATTADWLWKVEDIEELLPAEDAAWWIAETGMKGLGNIAPNVDPQREFFRLNSWSLAHSRAGMAARLNLSEEEFQKKFESVTGILAKARTARLENPSRDPEPDFIAVMRMVSAYAHAFASTGREEFREKAGELLVRARQTYSVPGTAELRLYAENLPASLGAARAFHYALAIQTALDVAAVTGKAEWEDWAEDLATMVAENFADDGLLEECPEPAKILYAAFSDDVMWNDDSTLGLLSQAEMRLAARNRPWIARLSKLVTSLPEPVSSSPLEHTDQLLASLARLFPVTVLEGASLDAELARAVALLDPRMIQRRKAGVNDGVAPGAVKIVVAGGAGIIAGNDLALKDALLPSGGIAAE